MKLLPRRLRQFTNIVFFYFSLWLFTPFAQTNAQTYHPATLKPAHERILINSGWKFYRYGANQKPDSLIYDVRPEVKEDLDKRAADAKPTEGEKITSSQMVLKPWILPTGNDFINDPAKKFVRPAGNPGGDFPFVQSNFNDSAWERVSLPHDWAIKGPFYTGSNPVIGGGMGRLPIQGVAWYRKKLQIPQSDSSKSIFLDVDGAMSYAMVWLNGKLVGGWPYGYSSWRLDLTPYVVPGGVNQLAIRLDNPVASSRWYPGSGIYRNVWLTKTSPVHVAQWGTFITTGKVTAASATINLKVLVDNKRGKVAGMIIATTIYALDSKGQKTGKPVASFTPLKASIKGLSTETLTGSVVLPHPKLWGPPPNQVPNRYVAVTTLSENGKVADVYETTFGIRELRFDANTGLFVNGQHVTINGVNQHHDLGALGGAFNVSAAQRQLTMLQEMGCNAIRMSHNPPAPELLDLADRMGFLVLDEINDSWELKKTPLGFHLIFPDWHEQDLRSMLRRDRNHPSVFMWSFGNEVGEQYTDKQGAEVAKQLNTIVKEEDTSRPTNVSMNYAKPDMPLPAVVDVIGLNYQGEGIRNGGAYAGLPGITTPPLFPAFHEKFPDKLILSSENASAFSSRGEYFFPVFDGNSAPVKDGMGGDSKLQQVSSYELYSVPFGASADKVFTAMDKHPYVAGGFVWTGWDYLGEPTPYYLSRSSYCGIIDLAGFKKDRFYLYQSYWRPEYPMAHILPHWNWPGRVGEVTPVHVFTSGDEAELFLNGQSLGRKKKGAYEYRLRWDDVKYAPGELKVIAYKAGKKWAEDMVRTTGDAYQLNLSTQQLSIAANDQELSFITVQIQDNNGLMAPRSKNDLQFTIEGPGEIVATDNGDAANLVSFASPEQKAFNGLCLIIVKAKAGQAGTITVRAKSKDLQSAAITLTAVNGK